MERKLERVQKYFEDNFDVTLTIRVERNEQIAEIGGVAKGTMFRIETNKVNVIYKLKDGKKLWFS